LLLEGLVDSNDEVYQLVLLLRSVIDHAMAPALSVGQVAYMNVLIDDYLERRQMLFPDVPLRPKHHYLSHYAWQTLQFGPLVKLWRMRFEANHQYFKRCVRSSHNFVNVTRMLATRHQLLQFYFSADLRFQDEIVLGYNGVTLTSECQDEVSKLMNSMNITPAQCYNDITIRGHHYKQGCVLPLALSSIAESVFAELLFVVVSNDNNVRFCINERPAVYDCTVGCYCLAESKPFVKCLPLDVFADSYPLGIYCIDNRSFISLKYQLVDKE
jgi:hypothetical protein